MIPKVQECYFYSRKQHYIRISNSWGKIPWLDYLRIYWNILEGPAFDYMNRYMKIHPHLWETIKEEPKLKPTTNNFLNGNTYYKNLSR
jgi:hypothetical protein